MLLPPSKFLFFFLFLERKSEVLSSLSSLQVVLDVSPPPLGRLVVEGSLLINSSSVNLSAVYIEIKGGTLAIAKFDVGGNVIGAYDGNCTISLLGTNDCMARLYGKDPRYTPAVKLGIQGLRLGAGVLGVFGTLLVIGKPKGKVWVDLARTSLAGDDFLVLDTLVDWAIGSEIAIAPSDFEPHEAETHIIRSVQNQFHDQEWRSVLNLTRPLQFNHYAGSWEVYGTRRIRMRAEVGLLTQNIVITGDGKGEETFYTSWNSPSPTEMSPVCGNKACEAGETSETCTSDCRGPLFEYGASIYVSTYSEDAVLCSKEGACNGKFRRTFVGKINATNIELRYFGQNNLQAGMVLENLTESNFVGNISFNKGYNGAVLIKSCNGLQFRNSVIFRSILPAVEVSGGTENHIVDVLAMSGIFWGSHRGAIMV
jgi:hypothetical protein